MTPPSTPPAPARVLAGIIVGAFLSLSGLWLWARHGGDVWLEAVLAWCG